MKCKLLDKKGELKLSNKQIVHLKAQVTSLKDMCDQSKPASLSAGVEDAIHNVVKKHFQKLGLKNLASGVGDGVWKCLNGCISNYIIELSKRYLRQHVFSPYNICHAMNLFGMFNFQALHVLWWIKGNGEPY